MLGYWPHATSKKKLYLIKIITSQLITVKKTSHTHIPKFTRKLNSSYKKKNPRMALHSQLSSNQNSVHHLKLKV
jgi:hypothetical protein